MDCDKIGVELNACGLNGLLLQLGMVVFDMEQLRVWEQRRVVVVRRGKLISYDDKHILHGF